MALGYTESVDVMTKLPRFTVPHCKHCKNFTHSGDCIALLLVYGFTRSAKPHSSNACKSFEPLPAYEDRYPQFVKKENCDGFNND